MNRQIEGYSAWQEWRWVVGGISVLLLLGAGGLGVFAQQTLGHDNMALVLLALYVASWSYVLGMVGLVLVSAWALMSRLREQVTHGVISRNRIDRPRRRYLEQSELEGAQWVQQGMTAVISNRSADEIGDEATRTTKVA